MTYKLDLEKIQEILNKDYNNINEFEVRFGDFQNDNFKPGIGLEDFIEINKLLEKIMKFISIEYTFIVVHKNNYKIIQNIENINNDILAYPWRNRIIYQNLMVKKCLKKYDEISYNMRFQFSKEEKIDMDKDNLLILGNKNNPAIYFKSRKRISYIYNDVIRVDLSMFQETNDINDFNNSDLEIKYEVECELMNSDYPKDFEKIINIILEILNKNNKNDLVSILNRYKNITGKNKLVGYQPITLNYSRYMSKIFNNEYFITLKLDGERGLLYIYNNDYYIINKKMDISKYQTNVDKSSDLDDIILDIEIFNNEIYVFDILYQNGKTIMKKRFIDRLNILDSMFKENRLSNNLKLKEYILIKEDNCKDYLSKYVTLDNEIRKEYSNIIDGFIIVIPNSCDNVFKWKSLNTIDFKLMGNKLLCSNDIPFTYEGIDLSNNFCIDQEYNEMGVIEFYYNREKDLFFPLKTRNDKLEGNYIKIAQDNFESIITPFNIYNLCYKNKLSNEVYDDKYFNMKRFENWVKRKLLSLYCNRAHYNNLLDLGCGAGDDIQKFIDNNIKYADGYDISEKFIEVATNRFNKIKESPESKNFDYNFNVLDLSKNIINTNNIYDIITSFYSIDKFFDNTFHNVKYLKNNGHIIIITYCSIELEKINYTIDLNNFKIKGKYNNKKININIKFNDNQIINEDYVVIKYDEIIKRANINGLKLIESKSFSEYYPEWKKNNNYMSPLEMKYSFLHRAYIFKKINNKESDSLFDKNIKSLSLKEINDYCLENNIKYKSKKKNEIIKEIMDIVNK